MTEAGNGRTFRVGEIVTVARMFPTGHIRTPRYIMGRTGTISRVVGDFPNPEELAYGRNGLPAKTLYRVHFNQTDIWPDYSGPAGDTLEIELYGHWLSALNEGRT
jgi:nitrile hydratase subunit beta